MKRAIYLVYLVVVMMTFMALACDGSTLKPSISPEQQESWNKVERAAEGRSVSVQIDLYEEYLKGDARHPSFESEARGRLIALREEETKIDAVYEARDGARVAIDAAVSSDRVEAFGKADLEGTTDILASHVVTYYRNLQATPFEDGARRVVSTQGSIISIDSPLRVDLRSARVALRDGLNRFANAGLDDDCQERCLNSTLNKTFGKHLGGAIFEGSGRIDALLLEGTAQALWREPEDEIFGVPAQAYYDVLRQLPRELYIVRKAMDEFDDDETTATYRKLRKESTGPFNRAIWKFYFFTPRQNGMLEALKEELHPKSLNVYYGFWHRRIFDESEPVVMKWLTKTLETYDPEFWADVSNASRRDNK